MANKGEVLDSTIIYSASRAIKGISKDDMDKIMYSYRPDEQIVQEHINKIANIKGVNIEPITDEQYSECVNNENIVIGDIINSKLVALLNNEFLHLALKLENNDGVPSFKIILSMNLTKFKNGDGVKNLILAENYIENSILNIEVLTLKNADKFHDKHEVLDVMLALSKVGTQLHHLVKHLKAAADDRAEVEKKQATKQKNNSAKGVDETKNTKQTQGSKTQGLQTKSGTLQQLVNLLTLPFKSIDSLLQKLQNIQKKQALNNNLLQVSTDTNANNINGKQVVGANHAIEAKQAAATKSAVPQTNSRRPQSVSQLNSTVKQNFDGQKNIDINNFIQTTNNGDKVLQMQITIDPQHTPQNNQQQSKQTNSNLNVSEMIAESNNESKINGPEGQGQQVGRQANTKQEAISKLQQANQELQKTTMNVGRG